jgi:cold shock CspA family protein
MTQIPVQLDFQGDRAAHEAQPVGTVRRIDKQEGFGFLETMNGREIYFHRNSLLNDAFSHLASGTRVTFAEKVGDRGPRASTVKLLGKHGLR